MLYECIDIILNANPFQKFTIQLIVCLLNDKKTSIVDSTCRRTIFTYRSKGL